MTRREPPPDYPIMPVLEMYGADPPGSGRAWAPIRCPFHNERNASASVNRSAQRFMCHVCLERSEDAIGLVQWQEGCDFKRALEIVESVTGIVRDEVREPAQRGLTSLLD